MEQLYGINQEGQKEFEEIITKINEELKNIPFSLKRMLAISVVASSIPDAGSNEERVIFLSDIAKVFDIYKHFQANVLNEKTDCDVH